MRKSDRDKEINQIMDRLHLGSHSGDGSGINRLHWLGFIDFIIDNPNDQKRSFVHKLISVMCIRERTAMEYVNAAIAWEVLTLQDGIITYNRTYKPNKKLSEFRAPKEKTDEEVLRDRR